MINKKNLYIFRLYSVISFYGVKLLIYQFLSHIFWFSVVVTVFLVDWFFYHQVIPLSLVIFFDLKSTVGIFFLQFLPLQDPLSVFNSVNNGCHVPPLEGNGSSDSISTDNMLAGKESETLGCLLMPLRGMGSEWPDFLCIFPWHWSRKLSSTAPVGDNKKDSQLCVHWCCQWNRKAPTWDACCCPMGDKSPKCLTCSLLMLLVAQKSVFLGHLFLLNQGVSRD